MRSRKSCSNFGVHWPVACNVTLFIQRLYDARYDGWVDRGRRRVEDNRSEMYLNLKIGVSLCKKLESEGPHTPMTRAFKITDFS